MCLKSQRLLSRNQDLQPDSQPDHKRQYNKPSNTFGAITLNILKLIIYSGNTSGLQGIS